MSLCWYILLWLVHLSVMSVYAYCEVLWTHFLASVWCVLGSGLFSLLSLLQRFLAGLLEKLVANTVSILWFLPCYLFHTLTWFFFVLFSSVEISWCCLCKTQFYHCLIPSHVILFICTLFLSLSLDPSSFLPFATHFILMGPFPFHSWLNFTSFLFQTLTVVFSQQ